LLVSFSFVSSLTFSAETNTLIFFVGIVTQVVFIGCLFSIGFYLGGAVGF
jgi:hypothetical protein